MKEIKEKIYRSAEFKALAKKAASLHPGKPLVVDGAAGSLLAFVAVNLFEEGGDTSPAVKNVLLIGSDQERAEKLRDDCAILAGEDRVRFFGSSPAHSAQTLDMTSSISQIETLKSISSDLRLIVVASAQSIAEKLPPPRAFTKRIVEVDSGKQYKFRELIENLESLGFERKQFVESYGDIAVRGGIIDVFSYAGDNPLRLEFWGDTVESIREFDALSQRSIRQMKSASIVPALQSSAPGEEGTGQAAPGEKEATDTSARTSSLLDYIGENSLVVLDDPASIDREITERLAEEAAGLFSAEEINVQLARFRVIESSPIRNQSSDLTFSAAPQPAFNGSIGRLVEALRKFTAEGYSVLLTSDMKAESDRLKELIEETPSGNPEVEPGGRFHAGGDGSEEEHNEPEEVDEARLQKIAPKFLSETIHSGFIYHPERLVVFTEHEIFGRLRRRGLAKRKRFKGFSQKEVQQLRRGDFVVHVDHGIGVFDGLKKLTVGGIEQEVMKMHFLEDDVLYVNLNFINRVQKYSSAEGHAPVLNKLGTPEWEKAKARAKKRVKDIARDLMKLYARRKHEHGTAFSPDSHWQKELEASFMYEDTPDQASATLAVKQDMESSSPMDRLICGDVGFGKTEVAVRAAFKAVMDGKQVGLLVPTTILALQHYNTFHDRLSRYATRIEHLTRFKSKKEQKNVVEALRGGSVDIVIGTHRLLSKDIAFKDLGLLIIDEEHRFGVAAKEKLRQLKATVDTLSLTATPIPRTLHFSLMGARDLSLISTPPRNRLPIITEIIPASEGRQAHWNIFREAIMKELHRGGQVYVVHDRVQNIDTITSQIKTHVPHARVHAAHGQMKGHELEQTMMDFLEKKFDVLVATKIIESGLDIPSVNSIIINRADRFGLAELYQLRGRVGRSNIQAYAYLLVPPLGILPKQTLRRLQAIEEFSELGSGFNLAMRDLEIRGAGNIFGAEQSGFIMEMGFEMYERIVREAVEELKEEEFKELFTAQVSGAEPHLPETIIESDIEALIPDFYVESDTERLDLYRRLYKVRSDAELKNIREELVDRFGQYPEEVEHLTGLMTLRLIAAGGNFIKVSLKGQTLVVTLPDSSDDKFYGTQSDAESPFQLIMRKLADKSLKNIQLRQQGKDLTLQTALPATADPQLRLAAAAKVIGEMADASRRVSQ